MTVRQRQRLASVSGYRQHRNTGAIGNSSYTSVNEFAEDWVGPGDNFNFTVNSLSRDGGLINGLESSTLTGFNWVNYPADYFRQNDESFGHLSIPDVPSNGALAALCLSRTNPSRSSTEALENLANIGQLPGMIKDDLGSKIRRLPKNFPFLKKFAKYNLLIQFGILPVISDVKTLVGFSHLVNSRMKELDRLRTRGLRRTLSLWSGSNSTTILGRIVQSNGVTLRADIHKQTLLNITGHARWYGDPKILSDDAANRSLAQKVIVGYTLNPSAIYELMPWSWLIDYVSNLGTIVKASNNSFGAHHEQIRLMHETTTSVSSDNHTTANGGRITFTPYKSQYKSYTRRPALPSLSARIEYLSSAQWSILGSLAAIRGL